MVKSEKFSDYDLMYLALFIEKILSRLDEMDYIIFDRDKFSNIFIKLNISDVEIFFEKLRFNFYNPKLKKAVLTKQELFDLEKTIPKLVVVNSSYENISDYVTNSIREIIEDNSGVYDVIEKVSSLFYFIFDEINFNEFFSKGNRKTYMNLAHLNSDSRNNEGVITEYSDPLPNSLRDVSTDTFIKAVKMFPDFYREVDGMEFFIYPVDDKETSDFHFKKNCFDKEELEKIKFSK